jgi:hypothetical protein
MAIVSAGDVKIGTLIQDRRGGTLYYVQDIERERDQDGRDVVKSFVGLPVVESRFSPSGSRPFPLDITQMNERDGNIPIPTDACIAIGLNASRIIDVDPEEYHVRRAGVMNANTRQKIENIFEEMGAHHARVSDLPHSDVRIRGQNFENYTGGAVIGEKSNDEERVKRTRRKSTKPKKVTELVKVPDLYLEDAVQLGFIDKDSYLSLTKMVGGKEISTLREALYLAQNNDAAALNDYVEGLDFDAVFPAEDRRTLDDIDVSSHPVAQAGMEVTLNDAFEQGLLKNKFTAEALTQQIIEDDPESDEKVILDLEEAFRLVALDPDYLEEYKTPGSTKKVRYLNEKQRRSIIDDVKQAFNTLSKEKAIESLAIKISDGHRRFMSEFTSLMAENKAFLRHDPAVEVADDSRSQDKLTTDTTRVANNRPAKLTFD